MDNPRRVAAAAAETVRFGSPHQPPSAHEIIAFIERALGHRLTPWQTHYIAKAFRTCPDCHHLIHSWWYLTGRSEPCPADGCTCTG